MKNFGTSHYSKPTPKKWRRLGDSLLIALPLVQSAIAGLPISLESKAWIGFGFTILLSTGKFITNFFSEND